MPDSNTDLAAGETESRFGRVHWIAPDHSYSEMAEGQSRMSGRCTETRGEEPANGSQSTKKKSLEGPEVLQKLTADGG